MSLIPFDIEIAKLAIKAGTGAIVTRKGYPVEITCWNGDSGIWPVVGKIDGASYDKLCWYDELHWTEEGKWFDLEKDTDFDLFIETDFDL